MSIAPTMPRERDSNFNCFIDAKCICQVHDFDLVYMWMISKNPDRRNDEWNFVSKPKFNFKTHFSSLSFDFLLFSFTGPTKINWTRERRRKKNLWAFWIFELAIFRWFQLQACSNPICCHQQNLYSVFVSVCILCISLWIWLQHSLHRFVSHTHSHSSLSLYIRVYFFLYFS